MSHRKVAIIDGTQLLYRAEYGFPARVRNRHDQDVTGTFGFFALLRKALRASRINPTHAVVIFDADAPLERQRQDSRYKSNRGEAGNGPFGHLAEIMRGLERIGIAHYEDESAEADDVIATAIHRDLQHDRSIIISRDKDFYQLLSASVSMWDPARGEAHGWITPETLASRFGVGPRQWADYLALVGDAADNMPGIRGIGPVTARKLLSDGKRIEDIPPAALADAQSALRQRELHTLNQETPIGKLTYSRICPEELPSAAAVLEALGIWDAPLYPAPSTAPSTAR